MKLLFLFFLTFLYSVTLQAQSQFPGNINPSSVDVATLSDEQIESIYNRIQTEGLSINEAIRLATIQGMSETQAQLLRQRLNDVDDQSMSGMTGNADGTEPMAAGAGTSAERALFPNEVETILSDTVLEDGVAGTVSSTSIPDIPEPQDEEIAAQQATQASPDPEQPIYGHAIFSDQTLDFFTTTDAARAPDWYVLGSGDQIRITIFGVSQTDLLFEISDDGYIQPTGVPRIFLKGLSIAEAEKVLIERLSKFYTFKEEEFSLTIKAARTITVSIFGESRSRGGFTISALNTAFNALIAAGGPTEIGSVRNIELLRDDERIELDVYAFMKNPMVQRNFHLFHNDVIYIPVARRVVSLRGAVKRPMRYELKEDESLKDLIDFAGGLNFNTSLDFVQIQRVVNGEPVLLEYDLSEIMDGRLSVDLRDGDIVRIREIGKDLEQFIEIDGSVFFPGRYSLANSPTLKSLLERASVRPEAKTDQIFIERLQPDKSIRMITVRLAELMQSDEDLELRREDRIIIYDQQRYRNVEQISVVGEVRNPFERTLPFDERITIQDAIELAGGLEPTAAQIGYVFRTDLFNPEFVQHIPINVTEDLDFDLQPGDQLRVYDQGNYTDPGELSVQGAVNNPINLPFDPTLTVTDLLRMSGGIVRGAAFNRVDVFRKNLSMVKGIEYEIISVTIDDSLNVISPSGLFQLAPFDQVIVRRIPQYNLGSSVELNGEVNYPGRYPLASGQLRLRDLIEQAGGLTDMADGRNAILFRSFENTGPVSIDLEKALIRGNGLAHNPVLMDDDVITILPINNTIQIQLDATLYGEQLRVQDLSESIVERSGQNRINVMYKGKRSARWYINNFAGGFSEDANKWTVTVTRANGEVVGTKRRLFFIRDYPTVEPGSIITLRKETPKPETEEETIDWEEVQARSLQATTTLISLLILLDRLGI